MKIKYLFFAIIFSFQSIALSAQEIDQSKMDRDLKIVEDIVSSLIKSESNDGRFYAANPKANYIPGFGVMIDINSSGKFYSPHFDNSINFIINSDEDYFDIDIDEMVELEMQAEILARQAEEIERQSEIVARENERMAREQQRALEEKERQLEREIERREREQERASREEEIRRIEKREVNREVITTSEDDDEYTYRYSYSRSDDDDEESDKDYNYERRGYQKDFEDLKPMYHEVIKTFLVDYADLIGQLSNDDQVMLVAKGGAKNYGTFGLSSSDGRAKYSATVSRKNIADFKAGRISQTTFQNEILFTETKGSEKKVADLELFSSIFQRLYKTDLATTYYTSAPITYEQLKGFGVIYKLKMYSSTSMGRDHYHIVTQKQSNLSRAERDKKVESMYPQFLRELKQNIIDYGKTIKSLEDDESILFQIRLTECNSCDLPKEINVLVKNQTLLDLEAGKIDPNKAIDEIIIKELQ